MAWPPVVVGLVVALLLWRSGPLGFLDWIYTLRGMVIAQVLIATPIVTGLTLAALQQLDPGFRLQILSLGATRTRLFLLLLREIRIPILAAAMAGFGRVIAEVGAATIVGGNIAGQTQVLTTAIVQYTNTGDFAGAIALGVILLLLAFAANYVATVIQQRERAVRVTVPGHILEARDLEVRRSGVVLVHADHFAVETARCTWCWGPTAPARARCSGL